MNNMTRKLRHKQTPLDDLPTTFARVLNGELVDMQGEPLARLKGLVSDLWQLEQVRLMRTRPKLPLGMRTPGRTEGDLPPFPRPGGLPMPTN